MIRYLAFWVRLAAVAGIQAVAWLRERWHRLEETGVTEDNMDEFVGDLHNTLHEPTQELPIVRRRARRVTRIVRRRNPVTRVDWCHLPADPAVRALIFEDLDAELKALAELAKDWPTVPVRNELRQLEVAR